MTAISMAWAVAVFMRGSVLLAAALVASWLFGQRRPSGVSAWHRAMIVGLLVLPFGVAVMPRLPVTWLPTSATEKITRTAPVMPMAIGPIRDLRAREPAGEKGHPSSDSTQAASISSVPVVSAIAMPKVESRQEQAASGVRQGASWVTFLVMKLPAIYVGGVVLGLLRFVLGLHQAASLRRDCTAADPAWQAASAHWSQMLGIRCEVPVMVTGRLPVPATLGWLRPLILIPRRLDVTDLAAQRDAVLLHELAHVARRDALWQSLTRLTAVIYWCHPLMWLVGRVVEAAWDAACDSVCAFYLRVGSYSRSLADLALGLVARRLPLVGLCMARSSRLAGRIRRLKHAPNAGKCGPRLAQRAVLWAVGLSCALLAAIVTPVKRSAVADTLPVAAKENRKPRSQTPAIAAPKTPGVVTGTVLDEDGSPLSDAKLLIRVLDYRKLQDPHHQTCYIPKKLKEWRLASGPDGSFKFESGDRPNVGDPQVEAIVAARGRVEVRQLIDWKDLANGKLAKLRLTRGRVVAGRILAPDGRPVQDAAIHATLHYPHRFDWEPQGDFQDADGKTRWISYTARPVKSDTGGRFDVTLPVQAYAELCVDAPDWAPRRVGVQADAAQVGDVKLTKGWPLSGKVLNKNGQPVAGQVIQLQGIDGGKISNYFAPLTRSDKTDSAGRFKLLPASGEFTLHVVPATFFYSAGEDPGLVADGPLVLLAPTVVRLDGSDPKPTIVLREPETVTLSGRVVWEDGRAAEGSELNAFGESSEPVNGRPYYELAAGRSDKEGRYTVDVPRGITIHLSSYGRSGPDHRLYWPWPQFSPKAVQLDMGSVVLKNVTEDIGNLDWVLKPDKEQPPRRSPAKEKLPTPQPGDAVLAKLQSEIDAAHKRGEDPRLTLLERCFEIENENRGSRAAIGALHFVMRAGATTPEQSVIDGRERAARLLREHYLGHRDLDLLIDGFTAGHGGLVESEALLRAARTNSPHRHVRAAASLYLAELLQHRARMHAMFGNMDLAQFGKFKIQMTDQKGITQTLETRVDDLPEETRKFFKQQRNHVAALQKLLANFDGQANERAIVALLDDVIEHYAGVKAPSYHWEPPNYDLRFTRPVTDDGFNGSQEYSAQAARRKFQVTQLKLGRPAPDIVGKDPQGKPARLSDERGRVVVLTVGAEFGENDVAIRRCRKLLEKNGNAPLAMVSVVEEKPDQPYSAYNKARSAGITWKVIADPGGVLCARWRQITSPEVYVIDAHGVLRFHGMCGEYSEDFTPLVEKLLKKAGSTKRS